MSIVVTKPRRERLERQRIGAPIYLLAQVSGISAGRLSMAERGFAYLSEDEERRRREALRRIANGETTA